MWLPAHRRPRATAAGTTIIAVTATVATSVAAILRGAVRARAKARHSGAASCPNIVPVSLLGLRSEAPTRSGRFVVEKSFAGGSAQPARPAQPPQQRRSPIALLAALQREGVEHR